MNIFIYSVFLVTITSASALKDRPVIGCFLDKRDRDLPIYHLFPSSNTREKCIRHCESIGKKYASVQYGIECMCGDSYGKYGKLDDSRCQKYTCPGERSMKCGGDWANMVFRTKVGLRDLSVIGCFEDKADRDLPLNKNFTTRNSPEVCIAFCKDSGKRYAGVQYSYQCFCGDSYGKYGKLDDSRCEVKSCPGDSSKKCGGLWANLVFDTSGVGEIGCYEDKRDRDLPIYHQFPRSNTREKCIGQCESIGKKYAGVQYGKECWCGDSYGKYGKLDDSRCQKYSCTGDPSMKCGGGWANTVFRTKVRDDDE